MQDRHDQHVVVRDLDLEHAYAEYLRHAYASRDAEHHQTPMVTWTISSIPDMNWNLVCGGQDLTPSEARSIVDAYRASRTPFIWLLPPTVTSPELPTLLEELGLFALGEMPIMTADLTDVPLDDEDVEGLNIIRVRSDADLRAWIDVCRTAFRMSETSAQAALTTFRDAALSADSPAWFYLGFLDGQPAGTALIVHGQQFAGVWGIATAPEFRRRGVGRSITVQPLVIARNLGYRAAMLGATAMGFPVYADIGFETRYLARVFGRPQWDS